MNQLDALNEILETINETPMSDEDYQNIDSIPIAVKIRTILNKARRNILEDGWYFNYYNITLNPQVDGKIHIPNSYLSVKGLSGSYSVRNGKLYDLINHTFDFTDGVAVEVKEDIEFDDIPSIIASYIVSYASWRSHSQILNTSDKDLLSELKSARLIAYQENGWQIGKSENNHITITSQTNRVIL